MEYKDLPEFCNSCRVIGRNIKTSKENQNGGEVYEIEGVNVRYKKYNMCRTQVEEPRKGMEQENIELGTKNNAGGSMEGAGPIVSDGSGCSKEQTWFYTIPTFYMLKEYYMMTV